MCDVMIFTPVGTSLVSNQGKKLEDVKDQADKLFLIQNCANNIRQTPVPDSFFLSGTKDRNPNDKNPAEISSLFSFWSGNKDALRNRTIKIVLIHSPNEGKGCAEQISSMLADKIYFPTNSTTWQTRLEDLPSLDPENVHRFPAAMDELADIIQRNIIPFAGDVYLNITGGYKGLVPYLTMLGMALGRRVKTFYLHEKSPEIIYLPSYPVSFDVLEWRDWRGLLLPFTEDYGLTEPQKMRLFQALEGTKVRDLIQEGTPWKLSGVGKITRAAYEERRGTGISEFGRGALLLDRFKDKRFAEYLARQCLPLWRHLSVGDRIPETVEHGRGHVQRLLELAQQLFVALEKELNLTDEQLFVLISAIWLHDLGHSGDEFAFEGPKGLIQDASNSESTAIHCVYGQPEEVRDCHSILSYHILKQEKSQHFLFPDSRPTLVSQLVLRSVALACLFHRRKMPVESGGTVDNINVAKGIKQFKEGSEVITGFPLVTALLRFLDGLENQQERSGSPDFLKIAKWVINRQVCFLEKSDLYAELKTHAKNEAAFKRRQLDHYQKHSLVRNAFLVREEGGTETASNSCVFGTKGPLIGVYLVANTKADGYSKDKVLNQIIEDIIDEFDRIKEVLPFRMTVIFLENRVKYRVQTDTASKRLNFIVWT